MNASGQEIAVLGGGCFWCLEAIFSTLRGVYSVRSGYCGGGSKAPSYETICRGNTGFAEVIELAYEPSILSFQTLLDCFFAIHDPSTLNRQGHDVGTQYRSVIFCQTEIQETEARRAIAHLNAAGEYKGRVITEVAGKEPFFPAEAYHQRYYDTHPEQGYCAIVIAPKLAAFRDRYPELIRRAI